MDVNDLVFKEMIKQGYSREGTSKVWNLSDSKLRYLVPEQAQAYLDFQNVTQYRSELGNKEMNLIDKNIKFISDMFRGDSLNIVDLGCGDGKKVVNLLKSLSKATKIRYYPIDISGYMVEKAINRIKSLGFGEVVQFQWNISDFDNLENITSLLSEGQYKRNLFLLLGNTLGNFEMHEILHKIRNSMGNNDLLLIGNGVDNSKVEEQIVAFCKNSKEHSHFEKLLPMQLGFKETDLEYKPRFAHSRLEFVNEVLKDHQISIRDKKILVAKGDKFLCGFCYYLKQDEFKSLMNLYFSMAEIFISEDGSYALAVCKK